MILSIAYDNNLWVAGGYSGQLRTSTDAITWVTQNSNFGNTKINSIAYGNNLWAIVGAGAQYITGQISTSTIIPGVSLSKLVKSQDNLKLLITSTNGVLYNWNGTNFTKISTGINDNFVNGAIRNNSGTYEYIIQGNSAFYRSTDLVIWSTIAKPPSSSVNDIISKS